MNSFGITGPAALPYSWQLITLAVFINREDNENLSNPDLIDVIKRWFWVTTYGEVFAGINSATFKRSLTALQNMLEGGDYEVMERDVTKKLTL